jgi:hypothetical protein
LARPATVDGDNDSAQPRLAAALLGYEGDQFSGKQQGRDRPAAPHGAQRWQYQEYGLLVLPKPA